jgi:hypothetical protein
MTLLLLFLLAPLRAEIRPAAPTVGDPIAIHFAVAPNERVVVTPSPDYEIVSADRDRVVVRTFRPEPFKLHGVIAGPAGTRRFDDLPIKTRSVLKPNESLAPSPLEPPRREPWPKLPFVVGGLVLLAIVAAIALYIRRRRRRPQLAPEAIPLDPPEVEFRKTLAALAASNIPRWAELADATRRYLGRVAPELGPELTTAQLLNAARLSNAARSSGVILSRRSAAKDPEVESRQGTGESFPQPSPPESRGPSPSEPALSEVEGRLRMTPEIGDAEKAWLDTLREILHLGDLEKFSPTGAPAGDFRALLSRAEAITQPFEQEPVEVAA